MVHHRTNGAIHCILWDTAVWWKFSTTPHSPFLPLPRGVLFVAPSLWPTRVNESHVFDGGEWSQSRNTAIEAFHQKSIFNSGRGNQREPELLSLSLCHFVLHYRSSPSQICRHTTDSSDKRLEECGMGPTSTMVAPLFWCFGTLLRSDTRRRGVGLTVLSFPKRQCVQKKLAFA